MHQRDQLIKHIETEQVLIGLRQDGIVHVYYKPHTEMTLDLYHQTMDYYDEITGKQKSYFIFEAGEYFSMTKEAREAAKQQKHRNLSLGSVILINNLAYRMVAEFYYRFNKPDHPYYIVTDFDKGIDWIHRVSQKLPLFTK